MKLIDETRLKAIAEFSTNCAAMSIEEQRELVRGYHVYLASENAPQVSAEQGEVLPCPFCGSRVISDGENLIEAEAHGVGRVTCKQSECLNCGACGPLSQPVTGPDYGDVAAIAAWNRRPGAR
jgi:Lar family restriction alleviation protein